MLGRKKLGGLLQGRLSSEERGWILLALVVRENDGNLEKQVFAFEEWKKIGQLIQLMQAPGSPHILSEMISNLQRLSRSYCLFQKTIRSSAKLYEMVLSLHITNRKKRNEL